MSILHSATMISYAIITGPRIWWIGGNVPTQDHIHLTSKPITINRGSRICIFWTLLLAQQTEHYYKTGTIESFMVCLKSRPTTSTLFVNRYKWLLFNTIEYELMQVKVEKYGQFSSRNREIWQSYCIATGQGSEVVWREGWILPWGRSVETRVGVTRPLRITLWRAPADDGH